MKVVIRADASVAIGTGHIMRCLTLADVLRGRGIQVCFISRDLPGNCCDLVVRQGFPVSRLPGECSDVRQDAEQTAAVLSGGADWLVVDHYGLDAVWERCLRPLVGRIMVIDDLADRPHNCELLLDQNLFNDMETRYSSLVPAECRQFLGPRHALLRHEFIEARRTLSQRDGVVRRMLLFFGGSDPTNETEKALQALVHVERGDILIDVVVGAANPAGERIRALCAALPNVTYHCQISNMAALMARADLAVGAGGTTTWERCFLGLPTLIIVVAGNQAQPARAADNAGLAWLMGASDEVSSQSLAAAISSLLKRPAELAELSKRCLDFMGERTSPVHDDLTSSLCEVHDAA